MASMNPPTDYTPEAVRQAAEGIIASRPAYRDLITFYANIFAAQEEVRPWLRLEHIQLPEELIRVKRREHLPLIMTSDMVFDLQASKNLLSELCRIAIDCGSELSGAARTLSVRVEKATALFGPFLKAQDAVVIAGAEELGVEPRSLSRAGGRLRLPGLRRTGAPQSGHTLFRGTLPQMRRRHDTAVAPPAGEGP